MAEPARNDEPGPLTDVSLLADNLIRLEEEVDLDHRILVTVGPVDRIGFDRLGISLANGAFVGLSGIGRAYHLSVASHRIFALEDLNDDGPRSHECAQVIVERPLLMDGVETLCLVACHVDALGRDHAEACLLQHLGDRTSKVAASGVGLDDRKGARHGHDRAFSCDLVCWNWPQRLAVTARPGKGHALFTHFPPSWAQ